MSTPICTHCAKPFERRYTSMQAVCSPRCAARKVAADKRAKVEAKKAQDKADKARLAALQPMQHWLKKAEKAVNEYVRYRDHGLGCISCDKPATWGGQWHASHFRSVAAASAVRFNLWNVHKACSQCNLFLSGNVAAYTPAIVAKIGQERVDWLKAQNQRTTYTREYLERLAAVMRRKSNRLKKRLDSAR